MIAQLNLMHKNFILNIFQWFKSNMLVCPSKKYLGIECLGCGFQRSLILLFEGNFIESLKIYPATLPVLLTSFYTALHLIFNFKTGARNIKIGYIFTITLMTCFFIYKQILFFKTH